MHKQLIWYEVFEYALDNAVDCLSKFIHSHTHTHMCVSVCVCVCNYFQIEYCVDTPEGFQKVCFV